MERLNKVIARAGLASGHHQHRHLARVPQPRRGSGALVPRIPGQHQGHVGRPRGAFGDEPTGGLFGEDGGQRQKERKAGHRTPHAEW